MRYIYQLSDRYEKQHKKMRWELIVGFSTTLCIVVIIIMVGLKNVQEQAKHNANDIELDYSNLVESYIRIFDSVYDRIVEKIEENPSFDELDSWLKSKDETFSHSMGNEIYDGIALTYKGGYAHSWNYGDYSDYDASTRPWYRVAQEANGATAVVPPYVTFLDAQYLADDSYILMSIVKKYNDEISFDYDVKLNEIKLMLQKQEQMYAGTEILMYDRNGYILACSDVEKFAHNVNTPDNIVSYGLSNALNSASEKENKLVFQTVDGKATLFYLDVDNNENSICIQIPFWAVVKKDFLAIMLAMLLLIIFELYLYWKGMQRIREFNSRDEQLSIITNMTFLDCLYIDPETMRFDGSSLAEEIVSDHSYPKLFTYLLEKIQDENEKLLVKQFISPQVIKRGDSKLNCLEEKRINMNWRQDDGTTKTVTMELSRVFSLLNGKKMACLLMRDISEDAAIMKKALEQAKSASIAKSEFLTRVSHDMRTPLNVIIGMNHLAQENDNSEDTNDCLKKIDVSSEFLLGLINDVLDLERIESGKIQLNYEPYSDSEFSEYISSVIRPLCEQKSIKFNYSIDTPCDFVIMQDKLRINQVYFNLLSNAVKFTPEGGTIDFHTNASTNCGKILLDVTISDSGIGMSEEFQTHMFESFTQENRGILSGGVGSGLGLAIVKHLCDLMGMTITVESEPGHGTAFYIHGEYDSAQTQLSNTMTKENTLDVKQLYGKTILICEDHPLNQEITKRLLTKKGVICLLAEDGKRGVEIFKNSPSGSIAAILMDIRMPVMDGLQATREIRAMEKEDSKVVPIIALSANAYDEDVHKCIKAGMNAHLAKPFTPKALYSVLNQQINLTKRNKTSYDEN